MSTAAAAAAAAAEGFPEWALLEPYVFRRDDKDSFPDESKAPVRASATTSWGADFSIAFSVVQPPRISRLYAHMPGFPHPDLEEPLHVLATHRHLALLIVTSSQLFVQDLFIFRANEKNPSSCLLKLLPSCTAPEIDYSPGSPGGDPLRLRIRRPASNGPRMLHIEFLGLWCGDRDEEFVVAELTVLVSTDYGCPTNAFADICLLRSSFTGDDQLGGEWANMRVPILSTDPDELLKLSRWVTYCTIPFQRWLCWVDYRQGGILFHDVSSNTLSLLWFPPLDKPPAPTSTPLARTTCIITGNMYCSVVSVVDHGRLLKFVNVARTDGLVYGPPQPDTSFTITCHSLILGDDGSRDWKEDYTIPFDDIRGHYLPYGGIPIFPRVDLERPNVVHFLYVEFGRALEKMWVLSIDMSTKTVDSFYLYMDLNKFSEVDLQIDNNYDMDLNEFSEVDLQIDNNYDLIRSNRLSPAPWPFRSCEFLRFCHLSRKRKDMECP